jgi:peptidyl-prolyl cis-trans isomerase D
MYAQAIEKYPQFVQTSDSTIFAILLKIYMSLIQKIRERAAWIISVAIGGSLLAFIVQDAFYRKGSMFGNGTTVGKVNGRSIEHEEFENKVNFYDQANNGQVQRSQLIPSVWDFMVNQIVVQQEADKLGLTVSSGELSDILFGANPPQWMQQAFTDPKTGQFNAAAAKQQFAAIKSRTNDPQVKNLEEGYIQPTILQTLGEKYQALISGAVYVPKWMSEKMSADANSVAKASYVFVPYTTISDSTIKVSTDEMEAYIKKHASQYQHDHETRTIAYVSFSAAPSKDDSEAIKNNLNQLKDQFAQTKDEKTFLSTQSSETPYYNSFIGGKEIKQVIKDTLFNLPVGAVYGPYLDGDHYVLAKMVAKQTIPDSAKVRHILVATHQQDPNTGELIQVRDDSAAMKRLDSAIALIKGGASFDSVVIKYSDDPGSKNTGGVYNNFPSGQMDENFNDFSFTGKPGEAKVVQTVYGYHYVQILGQTGSQTGYKIAYLSKPIVASSETDNAASNAAAQFAASSRNNEQFQANAKKQHLTINTSPEFAENDFTIPGVGESRTLIKWAYDNSVGDISDPESVDSKYIVAMVSADNKKGLSTAHAVQQTVEPLVRNEKKAQKIIPQFKGSTLEQISASAHQPVKNVDSLNFTAFVVPELGNEPAFIGAAFNKQIQNKISNPIAGNTGVFVVKSGGVTGVASFGQTPETQKNQIEQMLKQQSGNEVTVLRKAANIKDYRSKFY